MAIVCIQLPFCFSTFANNVQDILIDVLIHDDGSATITEKWTGDFIEGTENYVVIEDKNLTIDKFKVKLNDVDFEYLNKWDVNKGFNDKKYKCGINKTYNGIELCFGISEYGNNTYQFSYDVSPLVKKYFDCDGFNFMFLNPGMSIYPSNAKILIRLENGKNMTKENARIWGFGFDGEVLIKDGQVLAYTTSKLYDNNSVILMLKLSSGTINPSFDTGMSFESIQKRAFEGSTYQDTINNEKNDGGVNLFLLVFFGTMFLCIGSTIITIVLKVKRHFEIKRFYDESLYFRDTPNAGDMAISHVLYNDFDIWNVKDVNIIGALIMKMIYEKNLEPVEEKTIGFLGIEKTNTSLILKSEPSEETTKKLYDIIKLSAGSDGILQENELKIYASNHYEVLNNFLLGIESTGHSKLNKIGAYKKLLGKNIKDLSDIGKKELAEVFGLKKFLDEFTLISERDINEVIIWENLLIYATLFGVAKKVLNNLKKLYPEKVIEIENYTKTVYIGDVYFRALYYSSLNGRNAMNAARAARRAASGFGGHVSLGGGGGFSGGGHGGGSR